MPRREVDKQLAQRTPTATSAMVLYSNKGESFVAYVKNIFVSNTTASPASFSLWVNQNGTQALDPYAIYRSVVVAANTTTLIDLEFGVILRGSAATILCGSSVASALTFTCYGTEVEET